MGRFVFEMDLEFLPRFNNFHMIIHCFGKVEAGRLQFQGLFLHGRDGYESGDHLSFITEQRYFFGRYQNGCFYKPFNGQQDEAVFRVVRIDPCGLLDGPAEPAGFYL